MNLWRVERALTAQGGGYGPGWIAQNALTGRGGWYPTWPEALAFVGRQLSG